MKFKVIDLRKIFTEEEYQEWLNTPNKHIINNQTPQALIDQGQEDVIEDLVYCILTGCPI